MSSVAVIPIGMDPNIIQAGGLLVSWHGFFSAVGILVVILWALRQGRRHGISDDAVYGTAVWAVIGGVIGARTLHVIDFWDYYSTQPLAILQVWTGGIALFGGIIGATIGGGLYAYLNKYPFGRMVDLVAPGILLGQMVGRIGDIINGEHLAKVSNLPWAFQYTHPNSPAFGEGPMHPAIVYEMVWDAIVFYITLKLIGRLRPDGMVFFVYLATYSLGRFLIQFLRRDAIWVAGLQEAHLLALLVLAVAVPVLAARARWAPAREGTQSPEQPRG
ncbi:MAG: prolipoprotein diacylglyceryl transferase [Chloroflexi bacterium]|nr:prolipoprotein diacylglyceryl transferase [Chloroflexota bacterium]